MPYELRIPGSPPTRFETEHEAVDAASLAMRVDRTARAQVIDLATGRPASLGDRRNWHEQHKKRLGF